MAVVGDESKTVSVFLAIKQNLIGKNVPFLDTEVTDKKLVNLKDKIPSRSPQYFFKDYDPYERLGVARRCQRGCLHGPLASLICSGVIQQLLDSTLSISFDWQFNSENFYKERKLRL